MARSHSSAPGGSDNQQLADHATDTFASPSAAASLAIAKTAGVPALETNPLADPAGAAEVVYGPQLRSRPAAATDAADVLVSAERALSVVNERGMVSDMLQPGAPQLTLRRVSTGLDESAAGFAPHPGWVLTWHDSPPHISTPIGADSRADLERLRCVFVPVVDARTGEIEDNEQVCQGR